ncbi:MAG: pyridoxamine 5-phosphate oxidase-related FMN-binding protein, partial [Gemmatimonadales bacterium]|nr:pyridoxamine 5-phosphate oxidase-related FMN-binding protein [Gemmatimonadales bacterium]
MSSAAEWDMPASKKIDELYDLIEGIETAMFTTRRADGLLVSRPMATQERIEGADLFFVT